MRNDDKTLLTLDGSFGEGGGQIIRSAVSLSALTGRPFEIHNIRARRSKPGLQAQHLTSVRAAALLCNADLKGAELGSIYLRFEPKSLSKEAVFRLNVADARGGASAGATGLVAQTMLVPMLFLSASAVRAEVLGGTHVPMSPVADYLEAVYLPLLRRMGAEGTFGYDRAGFFPRGGGSVYFSRTGGGLNLPIEMRERGSLRRLRLFLVTSELPETVALRGRDALLKDLKGFGVPIDVQMRDMPSAGAGAAITIVAECETGIGGWTALGERGKPMERVAKEALRDFVAWHETKAGVDAHLADQLVLPAALIPQTSRWTTPLVTDHLRTVLEITSQFLPIEFAIEERADGSGEVCVCGVQGVRF